MTGATKRNPLSMNAREILTRAAKQANGVKIEGRDQKKAARELASRGFGTVNKSVTRLTATPAGKFVAQNQPI